MACAKDGDIYVYIDSSHECFDFDSIDDDII